MTEFSVDGTSWCPFSEEPTVVPDSRGRRLLVFSAESALPPDLRPPFFVRRDGWTAKVTERVPDPTAVPTFCLLEAAP